MLVLLSPAKNLDYDNQPKFDDYTVPDRLEQSEKLIKKLRGFSRRKIGQLMKLSDQLADLNYERYQSWSPDFEEGETKQAIYAFNGDVYRGLNAASLNKNDLKFAQKHVRVLSGLHGLLKPLDLIKPYRLEMGTKLPVGRKKNLYDFWEDEMANAIKETLAEQGDNVIVNLASNEYFKAVPLKKIDAEVIDCQFKDAKNGEYKSIMTYAKLARGYMANWIIKSRAAKPEDLQQFNEEGYSYNARLSSDKELVFTRG